jgi:hypothetical protein
LTTPTTPGYFLALADHVDDGHVGHWIVCESGNHVG